MKEMKTKKKKILLYILTAFIILSFFIPNFLNNIRYKAESTFGEPNTFFYSVGIGIQKTKEQQNYYDKEFELDDLDNIIINTSKYDESKVTIYGKVANSADPLKVIVNDKVIYDSKMSNSSVDSFWNEYYLNKYFAVELSKLKLNNENEITLTSGNAVKKVTVVIE
jgi:hypothetical protein